jgi:hypothetical protein
LKNETESTYVRPGWSLYIIDNRILFTQCSMGKSLFTFFFFIFFSFISFSFLFFSFSFSQPALLSMPCVFPPSHKLKFKTMTRTTTETETLPCSLRPENQKQVWKKGRAQCRGNQREATISIFLPLSAHHRLRPTMRMRMTTTTTTPAQSLFLLVLVLVQVLVLSLHFPSNFNFLHYVQVSLRKNSSATSTDMHSLPPPHFLSLF